MTIEADKINKNDLDIKEVNGITFISTKTQDHTAEQILVYAEHKGKKYLAIAPKTVKIGQEHHFKYTSFELLATVVDIAKIGLKGSNLQLGIYNPINKKISWESKSPNKAIEGLIIPYIDKHREEVRARPKPHAK